MVEAALQIMKINKKKEVRPKNQTLIIKSI